MLIDANEIQVKNKTKLFVRWHRAVHRVEETFFVSEVRERRTFWVTSFSQMQANLFIYLFDG